VPVILLLVDGARADAFAAELDSGSLPVLERLRDEGSLHTITSTFPSVTGPAYAPFLLGRFPGPLGLAGLRWFDRARTRCTWPDYCRSYIGVEARHIDGDMDPDAPTLYELAESSAASMYMIGRGLAPAHRLARGFRSVLRTARVHFSGNVTGWLAIDRDTGLEAADHLRRHRPAFSFIAMPGVDKASHASGHTDPSVRLAFRNADDVAGQLVQDAERDGTWRDTHLWVVSDHGHSMIDAHDDLIGFVRARGHRAIAHPWVYARDPDVGVFVSGNCMAQLYLDMARRERPWWPALAGNWESLAGELLERPSVDLLMLPHSPQRTEVRARGRGSAMVERVGDCFAYRPLTGDPLGIGQQPPLSRDDAHDATVASHYPDSLVQIALYCASPRAGDIVLSAMPDWDFRARYEPIPHRSSHGALHREHMLVPLLTNRAIAGHPRRTTDVMPSACAALGIEVPKGLDGSSFL
jgi:arylsulfatase A-like enzyme